MGVVWEQCARQCAAYTERAAGGSRAVALTSSSHAGKCGSKHTSNERDASQTSREACLAEHTELLLRVKGVSCRGRVLITAGRNVRDIANGLVFMGSALAVTAVVPADYLTVGMQDFN